MPSLLRTDRDITEIYNRHVDTVYRVCYSFMNNQADTEDMVQETFVKLIGSGKAFESENHEKAWLIVTASNLCKDSLKKWWRRNEDIDDPGLALHQPPFEINEVLAAILELPADYKTAVYMYYYEGYSAVEIAHFCRCSQSTVRSRLMRARKMLKNKLGGDFR